MKNVLFILGLLGMVFIASGVCASPFIVCDPQATVTFYKVTGPAWVPTNVPAQPDGSIKMDIATMTVGTSAMTFVACNMWGTIENCSTPTPFTLDRPSTPVVPSGLKVAP